MMVSSDELKSWSACETRSQLVKWLDERGIKWIPDRKRWPITTSAAINKAIAGEAQTEEVRF